MALKLCERMGLKPPLFLPFPPSAKADGKAKQSKARQCKAGQYKSYFAEHLHSGMKPTGPLPRNFASGWG